MRFPPTPLCDHAMTEAELERERALDRAALDAELDTEPLPEFAERIVPRLYPRLRTLPAHWRRILTVFEMSRYGGQKWVINMPPRHGKTVCGLLAIAWWMKNWPAVRHAYATYGQDFSETQGRTMAKMLALANVVPRVSRADAFELDEGGALYITSRGSPLLGKGIDGIALVDDPYKDRKEAESEVVLETTWDWYGDVVQSRLEGNASQYLMHQRWNLDDMSGRLEESGAGWDRLVIKAVSDSGEALWPEVKSLEALRTIERERPYTYSSMYQQEPTPRGSCMFNEPERYDLDEWLKTLDPLAYRWCLAVDPAVTAKTSADHSAALLCAFQGAGEEMVGRAVDLLHVQVEAPELIDKVVAMRRDWMARRRIAVLPIVVEGVGLGAAIYQAMRKLAPADQVIGVSAAADKKTRATPVSAAWNGHRFLVPLVKNAEKWAGFVREHRRFTGQPGGKDDQVDVTAHAWNREFRRTPTLVRGPRKFALHGLG